jgi:Dolichyl-phosphate-mannose-protein mannosyltransferase
MIADTLACLLLFLGVALGFSWPIIGLFRLKEAESLVAGVALSLLGAWIFAWIVFTTGIPLAFDRLIPLLSAAFLVVGWRRVRTLLSDRDARDLIAGQLLVTGWCVAGLAFVKVYGGGFWTGDELEHWERTRSFSRDMSIHHLFIDVYLMPARPPLVNSLAAAFLQMTPGYYALYQVITTAFASLAYLPVALLAGRFRGRSAAGIAAVILMLNPLFVQNCIFPWTKLEAAFFILCSVYFFLRVRDEDESIGRSGLLCALCLGAACLAHYSSGPYLVVIGIAWIGVGFRRRWDRRFTGLSASCILVGACVLAPWFGWSFAQFGVHTTFFSNSTVAMAKGQTDNPLAVMALNLLDNVIPPQVRMHKIPLIDQTSSWGMLRDQVFILYQSNMVFVFGCVGWLAVFVQLVRASRTADARQARFWAWSAAGVVVFSGATYLDREHFGTAHICLQAAILCALGFLAARWDKLSRAWRIALCLGWVVDFCLGIALQFAVEDFAFDRWLAPARSFEATVATYSRIIQKNEYWKSLSDLKYFSDILPTSEVFVVLLMTAILAMALLRASRDPTVSPQK